MKHITIITIGLASAWFLQSCGNKSSTTNNEKDHAMPGITQTDSMDHDMMRHLDNGISNMKSMKMTGDFDLDFANMMIVHHQAAIDMSEIEIAKGSDALIKTMAQNIITAQKTEIEQLQHFIKTYKMPKAEMKTTEMHSELTETMNAMNENMSNMQMTGDTDKDFVMMMIHHHESAVTMAKDELKHGKHYELKQMAKKMIADQSKEIAELNAWLSGHR